MISTKNGKLENSVAAQYWWYVCPTRGTTVFEDKAIEKIKYIKPTFLSNIVNGKVKVQCFLLPTS